MTGVESNQASVAEAVRWLGPVGIAGDTHDALFAHPISSVSYEIIAEPGDRIVSECALLPDAWDRNTGGVEFRISITTRAGTRQGSVVVDPRAQSGHRRWIRLAVGTGVTAQETVTVTLATGLPPGAGGAYAMAVWGAPSLERRRHGATAASVTGHVVGRMLREGPKRALRSLYAATHVDGEKLRYQAWFERHAPGAAALAEQSRAAGAFSVQPLISLLTPAYNTPPDLLRACVDSVLSQTYSRWEWCLANDASTSDATLAVLRSLTDPRIRVIDLPQNAGIAQATQVALDAATGDYIALLDSDDELTPDALFRMVECINERPDADVLYSDEDKRDEDGGLSEPYFKPDWSPDHLLGAMYICHFTMARRETALRAGGFRTRCDASQDHDLLLRLSDETSRIAHVPRILYHWRRAPMSGATKAGSKPKAETAGQLAVADHLERHDFGADVGSGGVPGLYRPRFRLRGDPSALVVVLGDDPAAADACARRIGDVTTHPRFNVTPALPVSAELNALLASAQADHVVFIDAAFDVLDADWLSSLVEFSQQEAIGAVGGKVQYADGRLRHIGLLLGVGAGVARAMHQHPGTSYGYFSSSIGLRNYSAVSGELMMTRHDLIARLGGFDEALPWNGADVDYCLRARRAGLRIVFTPWARTQIRDGMAPAPAVPDSATVAELRRRWPDAFARDPYFNPNLSTISGDYVIA